MTTGFWKKSGIYKIVNLIDGKMYIGSAVNLSKRWSEHQWKLSTNISPHLHLQNAWNKYGEDIFKFEVLEFIEDWTTLIEREQHWIDFYDAVNNGYNLCSVAGSSLGIKQSKETIQKVINSIRKFDKWPHELGHKCRCFDCMEKKRAYHREWKASHYIYKDQILNYKHGNCKDA